MMTIDDLVSLAQSHLSGARPHFPRDGADMAEAIIDLFAEADPCGWPEPEIVHYAHARDGAQAGIAWEPIGHDIDSADARAIGRLAFRAADANDKENRHG